MEQGVREDRLQGRHRRPLAERARRLRARGHQLLHVALDHHGLDLRHVGPAQQPDDRRDDRRRRDLRRELDQDLEGRIRLPGGRADADGTGAGDRPAAGVVPLAHGRGHQPDHGDEAGISGSPCPRPAPAAPPPSTRRSWANQARGRRRAQVERLRWPSTSSRPAGTRSRPSSANACSQGRFADLQLRGRQGARDAVRLAGTGAWPRSRPAQTRTRTKDER